MSQRETSLRGKRYCSHTGNTGWKLHASWFTRWGQGHPEHVRVPDRQPSGRPWRQGWLLDSVSPLSRWLHSSVRRHHSPSPLWRSRVCTLEIPLRVCVGVCMRRLRWEWTQDGTPSDRRATSHTWLLRAGVVASSTCWQDAILHISC